MNCRKGLERAKAGKKSVGELREGSRREVVAGSSGERNEGGERRGPKRIGIEI